MERRNGVIRRANLFEVGFFVLRRTMTMNKQAKIPAETPETLLTDRFGRRLNYLRVSVTDRCNQRCAYCAPYSEKFKNRNDILSFDEITRLVSLMVSMGVEKVRLTGGEPLVRKDLPKLVSMLKEAGVKDLSMTTNAVLLERFVDELAANGLNRINVSLDSLNPKKFKKISGNGDIVPVLRGIEAAINRGLSPVKINTVIMKMNEDELASIIDFAGERGLNVRFIECMPMSDGFDWKGNYVPVSTVLQRQDIIERVDVAATPDAGKAAAYTLPLKSGKGSVGFVSPMSNRFCEGCNRLRLTSDGKLRSCLPADKDVSLKEALRNNAPTEELLALIRAAVEIKPETGEYTFTEKGRKRSMIHIGG
ncbi:MAG: GTP 3',8-cyclase MoaA [Thermodesulfobacteriota bacterium]